MVLTMERIDIRYALAGVARDKRLVESLQWRSEEIFFAQENLAACVVDGTHTIKAWTWLMKWNTYQGHEFERPPDQADFQGLFLGELFIVRLSIELCRLYVTNFLFFSFPSSLLGAGILWSVILPSRVSRICIFSLPFYARRRCQFSIASRRYNIQAFCLCRLSFSTLLPNR